jgi:hypothetical protein
MKSMLFAAALAIGALPMSAIAQPAQVTQVPISCEQLASFGSGAMDGQDIIFGVPRSQWTSQIAGQIQSMAWRCSHAATPMTQAITQRANALAYQAQQQADGAARANALAARDRQAASSAAAADRRAQLTACEATPAHALYSAQEGIISGLENIADFRSAQSKERRITETSGVRDLRAERNNGEWIVELQDELKSDFAEYKRLGGKAPTPQKVTHAASDPCADLRAPPAQ